MKRRKIASIIAIALATQIGMSSNVHAAKASLNEDKLIGQNRYETAIEVSKKGWQNGAENAVLVNDNSVVDALAATPFAYAKDAPVLLTQKDTLNEKTKEYLKSLGVKNVYIIGGENVVSKKVEEQLKNENINVDRIQGQNREDTSIEIAKRLEQIKPTGKVSVVNGYSGLADAVSIASISANKNMPIILSKADTISEEANSFISTNNISESYIVGGETVVSSSLENKLPNATRISGENRTETNAKVISTFFTEQNVDNLYVAKDGAASSDQLIDALAVGSLAAKTNSPVMIVGNELDKSQKDLINSKSFKTITQVGGNGNENVFNDIKDIQNSIIASKPETPNKPEDTNTPENPVEPEVPNKPEDKPEDTNKPESKPDEPNTPEVPSTPENPVAPEDTNKPEVPAEPSKPNTDESKDPGKVHNIKDGNNKRGLGDTAYEELKTKGWERKSDTVLTYKKGYYEFENLKGRDNGDAKLTIKAGAALNNALDILKLMHDSKEAQYLPKDLLKMVNEGGVDILQDGSRYIKVEYSSNLIWKSDITITFSNYGITPVHKIEEGSNKYGFGDTTFDELKKIGWTQHSNDSGILVSKNKNVTFTNRNGMVNPMTRGPIDAVIEAKNVSNMYDPDILYPVNVMLGSIITAKELCADIQEAYNSDSEKLVTSYGNGIVIEFEKNSDGTKNVKITFNNIKE